MSDKHTALAEIAIEYQEVKPDMDLDDFTISKAKSPIHPLHKRFEWDKDIAAHQWNRQQSRTMWLTFNAKKADKKVLDNFVVLYGDVKQKGPQMGSHRDGDGMQFLINDDPYFTLRHMVGDVPCATSIPGLINHCEDALEEAGLGSCIGELLKIQRRVSNFLKTHEVKKAA